MKTFISYACTLLVGLSCASSEPSFPRSAGPSATNAAAQVIGIRSFVQQTFIHGVPFEEARQFSGEDVTTLLTMLADPTEEHHWANVVVTLCMIGDGRSIDPVIAFIANTSDREISPAHYTAKTSAIMSLGYVLHESGDQRCLDYLRAGCDPSSWAKRGIGWFESGGRAGSERDEELSTMAILGLSLAGTSEARAVLEGLAEATARVPFYKSVQPLIVEGAQANARIERMGMTEYYRKSQH